MGEEIIDLQDVLERVQDDKALLLELFDIYQKDFVDRRQALQAAITAKDTIKIKEIIHSMKGSAGNISAKPLYAACVQLEMLAQQGKIEGMQAIVRDIDGYFERIKIFAANFKKGLGS